MQEPGFWKVSIAVTWVLVCLVLGLRNCMSYERGGESVISLSLAMW